jgi:hypothetical protein
MLLMVKHLQHFIAETVAGEDDEQLFMKLLCFSNSNGHFELVLVVSQFCNQTPEKIIIGSLDFYAFSCLVLGFGLFQSSS